MVKLTKTKRKKQTFRVYFSRYLNCIRGCKVLICRWDCKNYTIGLQVKQIFKQMKRCLVAEFSPCMNSRKRFKNIYFITEVHRTQLNSIFLYLNPIIVLTVQFWKRNHLLNIGAHHVFNILHSALRLALLTSSKLVSIAWVTNETQNMWDIQAWQIITYQQLPS